MKPKTTNDVLDMLEASVSAAALGTAMELDLFWLLEAQPLDAAGVARTLGIPPIRCGYLLQLLSREGLIEQGSCGYEPSSAARALILDAYSRDTWALLAAEARERLPALCQLPIHIREPGSTWKAIGLEPQEYFPQMVEDPKRARRFTRMLFELHSPLAEELSRVLDLTGVLRLMDLGGGSGVMSLALARLYPNLAATVVDISNVCLAGREIAAENSLENRITYHPADFCRDALPSGFDMVLECDVNVYSKELFSRVRDSLNPGGRFVIVDQLAPAEGVAPASRLHWAFEGSLDDPDYSFPTAAQVLDMLRETGFSVSSHHSFSAESAPSARFTKGLTLIEAHK